MSALSRALVRAALAWLVLGLVLRAATVWPGGPLAAALEPAALHALVLGWLSQLAFGVAWWMFPRPRGAPATPDAAAGWTGFVAINAGLLLRLAAEPASRLAPGPWADAGRTGAAFLLLAGVMSLVVPCWRRVGVRPSRR